uniref:JmjC domain-containing protein n=1 Tax=Chlamydomonas leiostraca TaxID=1034604 RepID=A0A7S0S4F7_9CHLO|mmetsp:Transcript_8378/g.20864  ORF Transcript_8378/g.20864 Transcript_8378/m.20864 type:complete len:654 (+) Transcript_8378:395-2356(+)|eukprot:CAMPEP_0202869554 /NCGR_PEP_ID=MMETSP1391-20130828/12518_1 /ASSEMBLY_ACC=CAM_ASM_000867 /TAXON_ID=1034604 /ORGANISM="Chlamydomonas leiostraca, Strain SAG 11-49" /LENGTH=653 /DNA_ID=CAMNT_0049549889 /DNA_START=393 /DNA_END=2354 /DNA_ORIENTATION=-
MVQTRDSTPPPKEGGSHGGNWCPVYRPTRAEFERPFTEYVGRIFREHPELPMFKVVPPAGWRPRKGSYPDLKTMRINTPIRQHVFGTRGAYRCMLVEQKEVSAGEFKKLALEEAANNTGHKGQSGSATASGVGGHVGSHLAARRALHDSEECAERSFWSSITLNPPMYGADTPLSLFDAEIPYGWNLRNLGDLLQTMKSLPHITGVNTPMTYFGMWRSFFGWHKEDVDLYSINYLHFGAPKVWYCVSPDHKEKFDRMVSGLFPELAKACKGFVRHKDILLSPNVLRTHGIPYMQAKQQPNEFVVLNAAAYHSGFNLGFNCAEAVNFATRQWVPVGKEAGATRCTCHALKDCVRLDMRMFDPKWVDPWASESESEDESEEDSEGGESDSGTASESEYESSEGGEGRRTGRKRTPTSKGAEMKAEGRSRKRKAAKAAAGGKAGAGKSAGRAPKRARRGGSPTDSAMDMGGEEGDEGEEVRKGGSRGAKGGRAARDVSGRRAHKLPTKFKDSTLDVSLSLGHSHGGSGASRRGPPTRRGAPSTASAKELQPVGDPFAVVGEEAGSGERHFSLVQRVKAPASRRGHVVLRELVAGPDGLYRPTHTTWEEAERALVKVRTQQVAATKGGRGAKQAGGDCAYKLLTLRSRILDDTDLLD